MVPFVTRLLSSFALSAAMLSAPAVAADAGESQQSVVRYADLDLASPAGAAQLQTRIRHAAERVCGAYDLRDLTAHQAVRSCRSVAMAEAMPQVQMAMAQAHRGVAIALNDRTLGVHAR